MAEMFRTHGYRTAAFSDNPFISERTKVTKGFSKLNYHEYTQKKVEHDDGRSSLNRDQVTELLFDELSEWIQNNDPGPWFAYLHTLRPHNPYVSKEPFLSKYVDLNRVPEQENPQDFFRRYEEKVFADLYKQGWSQEIFYRVRILHDLYLSNIEYIDALLGEFLQTLEDVGQLENTLIVIMSDHGEAFGQHRNFLHAKRTPFRELTHVPLLLLPPASWKIESRRITTPVELIDLFPTFIDAFDMEDPLDRDGQSLMPLLRQDEGYTEGARFTQSEFELAVIENQQKLIIRIRNKLDSQGKPKYTPRMITRLYNLKNDPGEENNLFFPDVVVNDLFALTKEYVENQKNDPAGDKVEFTEEEQETIESLGYIN
jgi:arylsulfatase A-like enzyme